MISNYSIRTASSTHYSLSRCADPLFADFHFGQRLGNRQILTAIPVIVEGRFFAIRTDLAVDDSATAGTFMGTVEKGSLRDDTLVTEIRKKKDHHCRK